jgi:transketolase
MQFDPKSLRRTIIEMAFRGQSVHVGCAFSLVEIYAVLYRSILNLGSRAPRCPQRDYLILSKGHGVMAQYACMHEMGWLSDQDIQSYFGEGTELKGLSECNIPGLEVSSGSLGHGLSIAVGMALAAKKKQEDRRIYCIVGDGEMNEGSIWEALMFASHFRLDNLYVIVDENKYQAMGTTEEVMNMGDIRKKLEAFGFSAMDADGHNENELTNKFQNLAQESNGMPKAIVARTVKGKGVSFMEADNIWHYTRLTEQTYQAAMAELQGTTK